MRAHALWHGLLLSSGIRRPERNRSYVMFLEIPLMGRTCGVLSSTSRLRLLAQRMHKSRVRRVLTNISILLAGAFVAPSIQEDLREENGARRLTIAWMASSLVLFQVAIALDVGCTVVSYGLWHDPKRSLLRRSAGVGWRLLDLVVLLVSVIVLVWYPNPRTQTNQLRVIETIESLRLLTLIPRVNQTRKIANTLLAAVPRVLVTLAGLLLTMFMFSVFGVVFFGGRLGACIDACGERPPASLVPNRTVCEASGLTWAIHNPNFDNVGNAMLALWQVGHGCEVRGERCEVRGAR